MLAVRTTSDAPPRPGSGRGGLPSPKRCPSRPYLSPRAPCCPSPPDRPPHPQPGARSPVPHLQSSDVPVPPYHLPPAPFLLPRRVTPYPAALSSVRDPPRG